MTQRLKTLYGIFGIIFGVCLGMFMKNFTSNKHSIRCHNYLNSAIQMKSPLEAINLTAEETPSNSQRTLVFVGVMTSKDFLPTRAKSVYETWGKQVPGRLAFFSSESSTSNDLPVIGLKGVDDRYPPQKKSFMMLHYMYENFIDKFEWFLRADDDVFIKPDKLEKFLRRVDSSKAQFIGQAGRGNNEEFGLLSLEFDENFCMGGPGIIMSRQTLKQVAPHIQKCLKNLYSTHEDVEIGRCVQKFAGVPCTWNYEMQSIFHHNSSGNRAFAGILKNKEVHSAITLHPVKKPAFMYRMFAYYMGLTAQQLRQDSLYLHRDIAQMINLLQIPKTHKMLARGVPLFPENEDFTMSLIGDHEILGNNPNLNRFSPQNVNELIEWNFLAKSIYSSTNLNPKQKMESSLREGIDDVIREIMEHINTYSRQRGRVIDYRELLYGYSRVNSLYGQDLILDLLLVYKKYRGKKMTVPVRKHLYIQRSFSETKIREIDNSNQEEEEAPRLNTLGHLSSKMKSLFNEEADDMPYQQDKEKICFILPLSGREEIFLRFLKNFESVVLKKRENVELIISFFLSSNDYDMERPAIFELVEHLNRKYSKNAIKVIKLRGEFSRGNAIDRAVNSNFINSRDIIFLIDVDVIFNSLTLERIRRNTIKNRQVYLPIVYSEYNPSALGDSNSAVMTSSLRTQSDNSNILFKYENTLFKDNFNISDVVNNDNGYFREFGYGLVSIYKCDIVNKKINGFVTDVKGWGLEDVKFLEKLLAASFQIKNQLILSIADGTFLMMNQTVGHEMEIFRTPDESLIHVYHQIVCDNNLEKNQYKMCLGTKSSTLGNFHLLKEKYLLKNDFNSFIDNVKKLVADH